MKTALLAPKEGVQVRDPVSGLHLDPKGEEKELTPYWRRRIKDGDVERKSAEKPAPKKKEA